MEQWRSWIAYVPQKVKLFKGTIRSNLTLGLNQEVSDQKLWQALEIAQAKDFVSEKEGLLDALVEAGGEISQVDKNKGCLSPEQSCAKLRLSS